MTVGRVAGVAALILAGVLAWFILFSGGGGTTYVFMFQNASQLVNGDQVQVGGRGVGSVTDIKLTQDNQAAVTVEVQEPYAPLHRGTTAVVRLTSLSGVANRYIAVLPGPDSAPEIPAGSTLGTDTTTSAVDLDQLFNTLDAPTRKGLANLLQGLAAQYQGKGPQANAALKYFGPSLSTTAAVTRQLAGDQQSFQDFVLRTSQLVSALSTKSNDLTSLISNANTTAGAIAQENTSLAQALDVLPQTLRQGSTTFVNLRSTLGDLDKLVAVSKPATKNLASFLATLRPLLRNADPTVTLLAKTLGQPGPANDLYNLLSDSPSLASTLKTASPNSVTALEKATPVLKFLRPYTPDLIGWIRDFGQTTTNYDANGHYARVQPIFNSHKLDGANTLQPIPPSDKYQGFQSVQINRCPGSASQPPTDGSAPWRDASGTLECNPAIQIPGP